MSSRKPGYLIGVILLALVLSAPQILVVLDHGSDAYQTGSWPTWSNRLPPIPGTSGEVVYGYNILTNTEFWQDHFIYVVYRQPRADGVFDFGVDAINPESGETTRLDFTVSGRSGFQPMSFGDRLWMFGSTESYEIVAGATQPRTFVAQPGWVPLERRLLLNGEAAHVLGTNQGGFRIATNKAGAWGSEQDIVLPSRFRDLTLPERGAGLSCLNQGDRVHVFLHSGGRLFYREGLELKPTDVSGNLYNRQLSFVSMLKDEPVSALSPANLDGEAAGWSLVREEQTKQTAPPYFNQQNMHGMLVGGQPAALIVEDHHDGTPIAQVYRFDGSTWNHFASQTFPFGSNQFRAVTSRDGLKSYIVATTTTGTGHVFAVEATGIRATKGGSKQVSRVTGNLLGLGLIPIAMLVLGCLNGVGTWFLMWRYTRANYSFGVQNVKLASLGRRGLARLVDLGLIVLTTAGLGWFLTRGFDWLTFFEALNLRVDHPTRRVAARVAPILVVWLVAAVFTLLVVQARRGITPGKWLCGLRVLRTTLKPCGFARSLVREVVLGVDACNFLCWAPGILSISLTDCRQRLGDLVADTIVVEARSLKQQPVEKP